MFINTATHSFNYVCETTRFIRQKSKYLQYVYTHC